MGAKHTKTFNEGPISLRSRIISVAVTLALLLTIVVANLVLFPANGDEETIGKGQNNLAGASGANEDTEIFEEGETNTQEQDTQEYYSGEVLLGDEYAGVFSSELLEAGVALSRIENYEELTGEHYEGNVYTFESGAYDFKIASTVLAFESEVELSDTAAFDVLVEHGFRKEPQDDGFVSYILDGDTEDTACMLSVGDGAAYNGSGDEASVHVCDIYFGNASLANHTDVQDVGVRFGGIGADSSLGEVLDAFGTPTYADVYEPEEDAPYIVLYYSSIDVERNTMDELAVIFLGANDGYALSEIVVSVF